ncbi:MAG: diphosphomevalonate decarboxylase [Pseudomonadota bacterium]
MSAHAFAHPNIALIKYWGKRDRQRNLPAVGSISITLSELGTQMRIRPDADLSADQLSVNGEARDSLLPRVSACLDRMAGASRLPARIESEANFPLAAGLASSASAFAALVVAANEAYQCDQPQQQLAQLAGAASGSAARSLYGGFVELDKGDTDIELQCLAPAGDWPLAVVVAITEAGPKPVSSGEAMEISRKTSPFYGRWLEQQPHDLDEARSAIEGRDFERLAAISEHSCLKMHSVMWGSRPPLIYWNSATVACMEAVREMQARGVGVFFTIDAGPQLKAVCLPEHSAEVEKSLTQVAGVIETRRCGLGEGARITSV